MKRTTACLMAVFLLFAMVSPGGRAANAAGDKEAADFQIGASSSEMIAGGGNIVSTQDKTYFLNESGQLICDEDVITEGNLSCLILKFNKRL